MKETTDKRYLSPAFRDDGGQNPLEKSLNFFLFNGNGILEGGFMPNPKAYVEAEVKTAENSREITGIRIRPHGLDDLQWERFEQSTDTYALEELTAGPYDPQDKVWKWVKDVIGKRTFNKYFTKHPISFDNLNVDESVDNTDGLFQIVKDENGHAVFRFKEDGEGYGSVIECQLLDIVTLLNSFAYRPRMKEQ